MTQQALAPQEEEDEDEEHTCRLQSLQHEEKPRGQH